MYSFIRIDLPYTTGNAGVETTSGLANHRDTLHLDNFIRITTLRNQYFFCREQVFAVEAGRVVLLRWFTVNCCRFTVHSLQTGGRLI